MAFLDPLALYHFAPAYALNSSLDVPFWRSSWKDKYSCSHQAQQVDGRYRSRVRTSNRHRSMGERYSTRKAVTLYEAPPIQAARGLANTKSHGVLFGFQKPEAIATSGRIHLVLPCGFYPNGKTRPTPAHGHILSKRSFKN